LSLDLLTNFTVSFELLGQGVERHAPGEKEDSAVEDAVRHPPADRRLPQTAVQETEKVHRCPRHFRLSVRHNQACVGARLRTGEFLKQADVLETQSRLSIAMFTVYLR